MNSAGHEKVAGANEANASECTSATWSVRSKRCGR
jgi:hypothetical protein